MKTQHSFWHWPAARKFIYRKKLLYYIDIAVLNKNKSMIYYNIHVPSKKLISHKSPFVKSGANVYYMVGQHEYWLIALRTKKNLQYQYKYSTSRGNCVTTKYKNFDPKTMERI